MPATPIVRQGAIRNSWQEHIKLNELKLFAAEGQQQLNRVGVR